MLFPVYRKPPEMIEVLRGANPVQDTTERVKCIIVICQRPSYIISERIPNRAGPHQDTAIIREELVINQWHQGTREAKSNVKSLHGTDPAGFPSPALVNHSYIGGSNSPMGTADLPEKSIPLCSICCELLHPPR